MERKFHEDGGIFEEVEELRHRIDELEKQRAECRQVEQAVEEALEYARSIVDTVREPLLVLDGDLRVVSANRSFYHKFKTGIEETEGRFLFDLGNCQWDVTVLQQWMERIFQEDAIMEGLEVRCTTPDSGTKIMLFNARRLNRMSNEKPMILLAFEDVTERNRAEEALQRAYEELEMRVEERTADLARANEQLRREVEERRRAEDALHASAEKVKFFAYSISHDLKNPVLSIHGLARLLHRHYGSVLGERGKCFCEGILKASEQAVALVEEMNTYLTTKQVPLAVEEIDLKQILREIREEFSSQLDVRGVRWSEPESLPVIKADRLSILRILRNLVENALKYGGADLSEIWAGYEETDQYHIISVRDNGTGLTKEECVEIFKPFVRKGTSRGTTGTGLGLAVVKEIAEHHNGSAWAEPNADKGLTLYVAISKHLCLL